MKHLNSIIHIKKPLIATVGTFDGLHLGHQALIARVKALAQQQSAKSAVISFWPPPKQVLKTTHAPLLLNTLKEKKQLIRHLEIDYFFSLSFNDIFATYSKEYFIENVLLQGIGVNGLVVGENHRFGREGTGNVEDLCAKARTNKHFFVEVFQMIEAISSTTIRKLLHTGRIEEANKFLGYTYMFDGQVVRGTQLGRKIGFPTANLRLSVPDKQLPGPGIYAVEIYWQKKWYKGMLYIGQKSFKEREVFTIEVHIFDLKNQELYDHVLCIRCLKYLRSGRKISSVVQLTEQLKADKITALNFFENRKI